MNADELNELIPVNLESLMAEKELNASAWAKDSGLGHTAVRDILKRKVRNPTYHTLLKLADAAGVHVRRITVGPNFNEVDSENAELLDVFYQLEPLEREFLLDAARARIAARHQAEPQEP